MQTAAAPATVTTVDDAELGRVVNIWKCSHVEAIERQLLIFGPDRADLLLKKVRLLASMLSKCSAATENLHLIASLVRVLSSPRCRCWPCSHNERSILIMYATICKDTMWKVSPTKHPHLSLPAA